MKRVSLNPFMYEVFVNNKGKKAVISRSSIGVLHKEQKWKILLMNDKPDKKPFILRGFRTKEQAKNKLKATWK